AVRVGGVEVAVARVGEHGGRGGLRTAAATTPAAAVRGRRRPGGHRRRGERAGQRDKNASLAIHDPAGLRRAGPNGNATNVLTVVRGLTPTLRAMSPVVRFLLGSLAAMAVVVVGLFFALRSVAISNAERDTRERVQLDGRLIEAAGLSDGVLTG